MNKKVIGLVIAALIVITVGYMIVSKQNTAEAPDVVNTTDTNRVDPTYSTSTDGKQAPPQNPVSFSGTLEEVNIGCFADGECYIMVDGKHVTTLWGWTNEIVGSVKGVEGFGDLEQHIGKTVKVYANETDPGNFTLYGSADYYVELAAE